MSHEIEVCQETAGMRGPPGRSHCLWMARKYTRTPLLRSLRRCVRPGLSDGDRVRRMALWDDKPTRTERASSQRPEMTPYQD